MGLRKKKHCSSHVLMLLSLVVLAVGVIMEQEDMLVFCQASLIRMLLTADFSIQMNKFFGNPCTWFLLTEFQNKPGL